MSITSTPLLGPTETIQVGTPFSYSFIYSDPTLVSDEPLYYMSTGQLGGGNVASIAGGPGLTTGYGLEYTIANMSVGQVLDAGLPAFIETGFSFDAASNNYITFGGPTPLTLAGSYAAGTTATFGSYGPFAYVSGDSLKYTILDPLPTSTIPFAFSIKLARPLITGCMCAGVRFESNVLTVISVVSGQVNIGMVFDPMNADPVFTVTGFISGFGGSGTYTVTSVPPMGANVYSYDNLSGTGSGDVLLSASTTPTGGTAKFEIETNTLYTPPA